METITLTMTELLKIAEVGMQVKRTSNDNWCSELSGGRAATITCVSENRSKLWIGDCSHGEGQNKLQLLAGFEGLYGGAIVLANGYERTVLAVLGTKTKVFLLSDHDLPEQAGNWYTIVEMKENGWKVKPFTTQPETEIKELTMDEVAKLAGIPVGQLRIRKEDES